MQCFLAGFLLLWITSAQAQVAAEDFPQLFRGQVERALTLSEPQIERYRALLADALSPRAPNPQQQFVVLVDRNPAAQRLLVFLGTDSRAEFVGASPVSTGDIGRFDYYVTPRGVFEHTLMADFRAQGTKNAKGILGYGAKGMRVWDLGWQTATKGWGDRLNRGEVGEIRLQMHATDPAVLERRLGNRASKGCVRIPATLNSFLDRYGVLDAEYDRAVATGTRPWIWRPDHVQTAFSGHYLVVIDTSTTPIGR